MSYTPKTVVVDKDVTYLINSTKIIVEDRRIHNLNHSTKIIVLNKWVVVESGIKTKGEVWRIKTNIHVGAIIWNEEIKLTIGKNGKLNTIFYKNERITITSH